MIRVPGKVTALLLRINQKNLDYASKEKIIGEV
jgi:hypothetical protein